MDRTSFVWLSVAGELSSGAESISLHQTCVSIATRPLFLFQHRRSSFQGPSFEKIKSASHQPDDTRTPILRLLDLSCHPVMGTCATDMAASSDHGYPAKAAAFTNGAISQGCRKIPAVS